MTESIIEVFPHYFRNSPLCLAEPGGGEMILRVPSGRYACSDRQTRLELSWKGTLQIRLTDRFILIQL